MKRQPQRVATLPGLRTVARTVAPLCMLPAMVVNVAWADGLWAPWNIAAVASILFSAIFVTAAFRAASKAEAVAFGAVAALLIFVNVTTAFVHASQRTSDGRDHRAAQIATVERLESQRSQRSQARAAAFALAGETPIASLQAEIDQAIAADARRWANTGQCAPATITANASRAFCAQVAALRGKLAAAQRRDALDAEIAATDRQLTNRQAPASADPFTDAVAGIAATFGLPLRVGTKAAVPSVFNFMRSITLELIAAFGPAAWLIMLDATPIRRPRTLPVANLSPSKPVEPSATEGADHFDAFATVMLEAEGGATIRAGDAWGAWQRWCSDHGAEPGTQVAFGKKMGERFTRDRNGGRPQYVGVRLRAESVPAGEHTVLPFGPVKRALGSRPGRI